VGERFPALTRREAEVFELVGAGRSNGQIAAQLCLAPSTVKSYVNDLLAKLGVATRAEAVALFHEP
jgi:DNA-binding NarL/FixJ family response regulator